MADDFHFHAFTGRSLEPWLEALGELRIRVFREYPYLYDGTLEYEREYLRRYLDARDSLVVIVTGENGNPGAHEMLYGELDELSEAAALRPGALRAGQGCARALRPDVDLALGSAHRRMAGGPERPATADLRCDITGGSRAHRDHTADALNRAPRRAANRPRPEARHG